MPYRNFTWMLFALTLAAIDASGLPRVYIIGDSRTCGDGYVKYMGPYVSGVASVSCVAIDRFVGEVYPKIPTFKGAAMVHFMGGLDDVSCLDGQSQTVRQARYDGYVAEMKKVIDKMKADLTGTRIVHATMFKTAACSQPNYVGRPDTKGEQEKYCTGKTCRRLNSDVVWFNEGSVAVAKGKGIKVHDLYTFAKNFPQSDGRHFETAGKVEIAKEVAAFIKANLSSTGTATRGVRDGTQLHITVAESNGGHTVDLRTPGLSGECMITDAQGGAVAGAFISESASIQLGPEVSNGLYVMRFWNGHAAVNRTFLLR